MAVFPAKKNSLADFFFVANMSKIELEQLEECVERVSKKQKVTLTKTIKSIDVLINEINKCKQQLAPPNTGGYLLLACPV